MPNVSSSPPTTTFEKLPLGILLVEEYSALAVAIASVLRKLAPLHSVRVAHGFAEAETLAAQIRPDLFVLDLDPPPLGEIDFLNKLRVRYPESRLLVIAAGTSRELRTERGTAGAIQFIEKPFDLAEFGAAVQALVGPWGPAGSVRGTLRDLGLVDIAQVKCIGLSSAVVRAETRDGRTGEIYFEKGQITHAATGAKIGLAALEEMSHWPGGEFQETELTGEAPRTINIPWPVLLLPIVRQIARREKQNLSGVTAGQSAPKAKNGRKILVIDDTEMLLVFVADVLATADQTLQIMTAQTGNEGLRLAASTRPDLVLLDYSLTDMTGDKVCRALLENEFTAQIPVLMMSGHLTELARTAEAYGNVVAALSKPFLSGALIRAVEKALARGPLPKVPLSMPKAQPAPVAPPPSTDILSPPLPNGHDPETDGSPTKAPSSFASLEGPVVPEPEEIWPIEPLAKTEPLTHVATETAAAAPPISSEAPPLLPMQQTPRPEKRDGPSASSAKQAELNVTFSLDVAVVELTPLLSLDAIRLVPFNRTVALQISEPNEPTSARLEASFHLGPLRLDNSGRIECARLTPTRQPGRPSAAVNWLAIKSIGFQPGNSHRNLQFVAAPQESMRVQLTAPFEFVRVELSPRFELEAIFARARGTQVLLRNGGAGPGALFELAEVELDASGELRALLVRPMT